MKIQIRGNKILFYRYFFKFLFYTVSLFIDSNNARYFLQVVIYIHILIGDKNEIVLLVANTYKLW